MVIALACRTGSRAFYLDTTKDFFNSDEIIGAPILSGTPPHTLSLSQWLGVTMETGDLLWES